MKKVSKECSSNIFSSLSYLFPALSRKKNYGMRRSQAGGRLAKLMLAFLAMAGGLCLEAGRANAQTVSGSPSSDASLTNTSLTNTSLSAEPSGTPSSSLAPNFIVDANTGHIRVDRNAFQIETSRSPNTSGIPLPDGLVEQTSEGVALPVISDLRVPNSVEFTTDIDFINAAFNDAMSANENEVFQLKPETVRLEKEFNIAHSVGNHAFGEGTDHAPEDLLPRCLIRRDLERFADELLSPRFEHAVVDQHVGRAGIQVDPDHVARLDKRQSTTIRRLG